MIPAILPAARDLEAVLSEKKPVFGDDEKSSAEALTNKTIVR